MQRVGRITVWQGVDDTGGSLTQRYSSIYNIPAGNTVVIDEKIYGTFGRIDVQNLDAGNTSNVEIMVFISPVPYA